MSAEKHDGGPAFPTIPPLDPQHGMSLRDWFAGQALADLSSYDDSPTVFEPEFIACRAYRIADAMLTEREA